MTGLLTVLSSPLGTPILPAHLIRASIYENLKNTDAIFSPQHTWVEKRLWNSEFGRPATDIYDHVKPCSPEDYSSYHWMMQQISELERRLSPFQIGNNDISFGIATHFEVSFRIEAQMTICLNNLRKEGFRHIVVVVNAFNPGVTAALLRAVNADGWRIENLYNLEKNLTFKTAALPDILNFPEIVNESLTIPMRSMEGAVLRETPLERPTLKIRGDCKSPSILVTNFSGNQLYFRHTKAVLKHLCDEGHKPVLMTNRLGAVSDAEFDIPVIEVDWTKTLEYRDIAYDSVRELKNMLLCILRSNDQLDSWVYVSVMHSYEWLVVQITDILFQYSVARDVMMMAEWKSIWLSGILAPTETFLIQLAAKYKIPCVTSHAAPIDLRIRSTPFLRNDVNYALYGDQVRGVAVERGIESRNLHLTGAPHYDALYFSNVKKEGWAYRKSIKLDAKDKLIAVLTSCVDLAGESVWVERLAEYIEENSDHYLVLKPHPDYKANYIELQQNLRSITDRIIWTETSSSPEIIAGCDVVVTDTSSCGIEAIIMEKPVIVANLTGKKFDYENFSELGVAALATSAENVVFCVQKSLKPTPKISVRRKRDRIKFLDYYNFGDDGNACKRIADLLLGDAAPARKPDSLVGAMYSFDRVEDRYKDLNISPIPKDFRISINSSLDTSHATYVWLNQMKNRVQVLMNEIESSPEPKKLVLESESESESSEAQLGNIIAVSPLNGDAALQPVEAPQVFGSKTPLKSDIFRARLYFWCQKTINGNLESDVFRRKVAINPQPGPQEMIFASLYWQHNSDVELHELYGRNGRLGIYGARIHYHFYGKNEGRLWVQ